MQFLSFLFIVLFVFSSQIISGLDFGP